MYIRSHQIEALSRIAVREKVFWIKQFTIKTDLINLFRQYIQIDVTDDKLGKTSP